MKSRTIAEVTTLIGWGLFLAAILTGCWLNDRHEEERLRLENERLRIVNGAEQ